MTVRLDGEAGVPAVSPGPAVRGGTTTAVEAVGAGRVGDGPPRSFRSAAAGQDESGRKRADRETQPGATPSIRVPPAG